MKENIDDIIAAILNGTATDNEQNTLQEWLNEDGINGEIFENIKNYWLIDHKELEIINEHDIKNKIWAKAHNPRHIKSRILIPWMYRAAAVIAFILTFTFLIREFSPAPNNSDQIVSLKIIEKKNLAGVKSKIYLPDGSTVNLNAESNIKYIEGFKDSVRWVELTGEAFFDVTTNHEKPFIVKSRDIITKALGTAFNINAFEDKATIEVSLLEGKVEVYSDYNNKSNNKTYLEPGQFVSFQNNVTIDKGEFNYAEVSGWKNGIIQFSNADYKTIVKKLERWFGVKFENLNKEPLWNFDGKFENASLEQILDILAHSEQFEYQLSENTVKLKLQ